jgi:hypothetical protein
MDQVNAWSEEVYELQQHLPRPMNEWPGYYRDLYHNVAGLASRISQLEAKIEKVQQRELEKEKIPAEREKAAAERERAAAETVLGLKKLEVEREVGVTEG